MKIVLPTIASFALAATSANAAIHHYRIPQVSHSQQWCEANDQPVATRFAEVTNSKILSHGCEQNPGRSWDMVIEYARASAPTLVTNYSEFDSVHGLYESQADCMARRDDDVNTFREATGLEPVVAYCYRDYLQDHDDDSWTLRMDAFGSAKLHPQIFSRQLYRTSNIDADATEASIKATLTAFGATGANARITGGRDRTSIMVSYYAAKELSLVEYYEGYFRSDAHCESYRNELREIYAQAGGQTAAFFCVGNSYSEYRRIFTVGVVTEPLATEVTAVKYHTFEACEAKRAETEEAWRTGLDRNIVGSICAVEEVITSSGVSMRMFWTE